MMKRIIALLLALILTVGLLPTVALAAEGDGETSSTNAEVVIGKYNDKDQWEPGTPTSTLPDGVKTVSKTAKPTTNANEYEVTLQVVLQQTEENSGKAATVLVLDTSGSMAYCAECGKKEDCEHSYEAFDGQVEQNRNYYYKNKGEYEKAYYCNGKHKVKPKHPAGWFTTSGDDFWNHDPETDSLAGQTIYVESTTPRTSRLDAAKVAAENFLKTYSGLTFKTDGTPADNQNNRNLGRYVSVVSFATGAALEKEWVDVSNVDNYQTVLNKIKALKADGGTNLDAGLTYAEYLLKKTTVNDAVKNVIALTDGQPTYCLKKNCSDLLHLFNAELTIGNTKYCVHGNGKQCTDEIYNSTVDTATRVKNVPSKIYTVCFDAGETIDVPNNGGQISVSKYLSTKIATQPTKTGEQFAYDADNAEQLYAEFAKITQSIVSGLSTGTVRDTLPAGITVSEADKQKFGTGTWELNSDVFTKTEAKVTDKDKDGKTVTTYTYTYTYTVKIDPKTVKTEKVDGVDYAPLNGETTLTVKNSQGTDVNIPFPIPAGKVTMPSYTVTGTIDNNGAVTGSGQTVNAGGSSAAMTFTPAAGYEIKTITEKIGDGQPATITVTDKNSYTYPAKGNVNANITVDVKTAKRSDLKYVVKHVEKDNATNVLATRDKTGTLDEVIHGEAQKENFTGFTYAECLPESIKISATEDNNVITLYYTRNKYKVTYTYTGSVPQGLQPPTETEYDFGASVMIANAPDAVPGYTFEGWKRGTEDATNFSMPAENVTITGNWTKNADAGYTIEYYLETLTGDTFEKDDSLTITGRTGTIGTTASVTEADKKPISGFTFDVNNTNNKLEGEIVSGDPLTLKLYYTRNSYTVKYQYTGTVPTGASTLPPEVTYKYGAEVTVAENATAPDHDFSGWGTTDASINNGKFVMPAKNVTITGSWTQATYDVNLSPYVKKTLEVDGTLPTGFSETFKVDVTVDGQRLQQQGTVTMTAAGTSNFTMPTVTLTKGTHTIMVQEVVDEQTKKRNIAYGTNSESFVLNVTASGAQYGTTDSEENFVGVTESPFVTITNKYTQPTETFDLNTLITKEFKKDPTREGKDIPTGTYIFTAQIFAANDTWQQVGESPVYTGTATLNGAASGAAFDFGSSRNPTLASGTHRYLVKEEHGGETIDGITYDSTVYRLTITVSEDGTQPNVQIEAEPQASVLSVQSVEFTSKIIFTNTYFEEKDPNKCTIDFSKFVKKELTATGSKTVDEATFIVDVVGSYDGGAIANALPPTETQATTDEDVLNTTLTATIKNIVGGNVYEEPFTGSVTVSKPGHYTFTLTERKGTQSGVTYDEAHYQVFVNIMRVGDNLVIHDATTYLNNEQVELIKLVNDVPVTAGYIVFKNTIDTGKDDYYPIIIPTIINKDTGMLNKTDHFAYVIGYPDGTVHPNGQITRAEVATIFFRLLRDEVRDGAFTTSNTYSDVAYGKWYNNPISTMSALGIITGYPDGTFKPNKPITRAEFAAIAARFDETQSGKSATFSDVIGHWAAKEIGIAYYNDWIKGYPDGTFKPDQNITRAEAMTLINRVLERKPESPADLLTNMNKWTDNMDTSKWYYLDVQEATNSHGYTRKTFNYELWRQMLPDPDWSRYER